MIIHKGLWIEFDSFTSKYDGCEMYRNVINGKAYPYAHRTKGKAIGAACSIINNQLLKPLWTT